MTESPIHWCVENRNNLVSEVRCALFDTLLADALDAWNVVGGITPDGQGIGHEVGSASELVEDLGLGDAPVLHRVEQGDARADELHEVLVARDQPGLDSGRLGAPGYGGAYVTGYSGVYDITEDWYPLVGEEEVDTSAPNGNRFELWCRPGSLTPAPTPNRTCKFPSIRLSRCFRSTTLGSLVLMAFQTQDLDVGWDIGLLKAGKAFHGYNVVGLGITVGHTNAALSATVTVAEEG